MRAKELQDKTVEELGEELVSLREQQMKLRIQRATGQLGQTHLLKDSRLDIARLKTVMTQKAGK